MNEPTMQPAALFQTPPVVAEAQETLRKAVEQTVAESRAAYAKVKAAAEEATSALETSCSTAAEGIASFNAKAFEALRLNAEAQLDFVKSAIAVKTVSEFVTLQSEFASKRFEAANAQAKDMATLVQKVAADSAEPIKGQFAKTFKIAV